MADGQDEERLFHDHLALNYWGELSLEAVDGMDGKPEVK